MYLSYLRFNLVSRSSLRLWHLLMGQLSNITSRSIRRRHKRRISLGTRFTYDFVLTSSSLLTSSLAKVIETGSFISSPRWGTTFIDKSCDPTTTGLSSTISSSLLERKWKRSCYHIFCNRVLFVTLQFVSRSFTKKHPKLTRLLCETSVLRQLYGILRKSHESFSWVLNNKM